jgi:hypothetical protein
MPLATTGGTLPPPSTLPGHHAISGNPGRQAARREVQLPAPRLQPMGSTPSRTRSPRYSSPRRGQRRWWTLGPRRPPRPWPRGEIPAAVRGGTGGRRRRRRRGMRVGGAAGGGGGRWRARWASPWRRVSCCVWVVLYRFSYPGFPTGISSNASRPRAPHLLSTRVLCIRCVMEKLL